MLKSILIVPAFISAATALPSSARAQNWVFVAETSVGVNSIDRDTLTVEDGIATFWVKTEYVASIQAERQSAGVRSREQIDCAGSRIRLLEYLPYDQTGADIRSRKWDEGSEWFPIEANTFAHSKQKMVCGG